MKGVQFNESESPSAFSDFLKRKVFIKGIMKGNSKKNLKLNSLFKLRLRYTSKKIFEEQLVVTKTLNYLTLL